MASEAFNVKEAELKTKYHDRIDGISKENGVDIGVAFDMLKTNALEGTNYPGAGRCTRAEWKEIVTDFEAFEALFIG